MTKKKKKMSERGLQTWEALTGKGHEGSYGVMEKLSISLKVYICIKTHQTVHKIYVLLVVIFKKLNAKGSIGNKYAFFKMYS